MVLRRAHGNGLPAPAAPRSPRLAQRPGFAPQSKARCVTQDTEAATSPPPPAFPPHRPCLPRVPTVLNQGHSYVKGQSSLYLAHAQV